MKKPLRGTDSLPPTPGERAGTGALLACAALAACTQRAPAEPAMAAPSAAVDLAAHEPRRARALADARAAAAVVDATAAAVVDATDRPRRPAMSGPWQRQARVTLADAVVHAAWEDAPDLDGDEAPDQLLVVECRSDMVIPTRGAHPCPAPEDEDVGSAGRPVTVAFVTFHTSEGPPVEVVAGSSGRRATSPMVDGAARAGRLVGTRRVWSAARAIPGNTLGGVARFDFAEFGPGVVVRTVIGALPGDTSSDTLDVADLYVGVGLGVPAGVLAHRCVRGGGERPERTGAVAVAWPAMAPLVWRAALAHPFEGCATRADGFDAMLGGVMAGGATVTVTAREPVSRRAHLVLAVADGEVRALDRAALARPEPDAGGAGGAAPGWSDPLATPAVRVTEMARRCARDHVRYERDGARCGLAVSRDDGPLPGCGERSDEALDPTAPRPLAVVGDRLVFARAGTLFGVELPVECSRSGRRAAAAAPWQGALPAGLAASPDGSRVLLANNQDLWLYAPGRRLPFLLNPPGGALPRGTVRAAAFVDGAHLAAVISSELVRFEVALPEEPADPPADL